MLEIASAKIDRFGWSSMDKRLKDALCADWCDVLSTFTLAEVKAGIHAVFAASKGRLRSINEHMVAEQIRIAHRRLLAALPRETEQPDRREVVTPERAAEIAEKAGVAWPVLKRMHGND